jgi:hypothetical protein
MKYQDIKPTSKVGREFQHLEDLVFIEGSRGAKFAVDVLENLAKDTSDVMVKWDGIPTIFWGRNPLGEFVMVNKNAWGKKECTTSAMLESFILGTGNNEPWRVEFAQGLTAIWDILESQTPSDFRGYTFGDLLFSPAIPVSITNETVEFTPNKVTYRIDSNSALGKKVANAKVGIAAHSLHSSFGDATGQSVTQQFESAELIVFAQTRSSGKVVIENNQLAALKQKLSENTTIIDSFLEPFYGLSDMSRIIYTYVNQMSRANKLHQIKESFFDWLATSKVSTTKQARIVELSSNNPHGLKVILELVTEIMEIKNNIIAQLDETTVDITAYTLNETGGEGYIMLDEKVKLVARHRWKPH